ncbi:Transcription initiation factor TFIID subunit 5 [Dinochytrium kinnereticum]|nr:Transcription initiation factor TFIID subunit 5 [Dinochytrium kinnereticum]
MEKAGAAPEELVAAYLRSRGFKAAESALRAESKVRSLESLVKDAEGFNEEVSVPDFILFYNESEAKNPSAYDQSYGRLRRWIEDSLDMYKIEMRRVLYPVFVHSYLDLVQRNMREQARHFFSSYKSDHVEAHGQDVSRIGSIIEPSHVECNDLAQGFLNNRYNLKMSRYSFELLLAFLQDNKFMLLTRLINRNLAIKVETDRPSTASTDEDLGIAGHFYADYATVNEQPVSLGKLPDDPWLVKEVSSALHNDSFETATSREELMKHLVVEPLADSPARDNIPLPYPKFTDVSRTIETLKELRNRVKLSGSTLPSICAYTFHNTYDTETVEFGHVHERGGLQGS